MTDSRRRRVLVTGGGRGIGRAICEAFVEEGARVHSVARTKAELESLRADLGATITVGDVCNRDDVAALRRDVESALGGLDVLVNNAGIWMEREFLEYTPEEWDRTLATNLTSVFDVTRSMLPLLLEAPDARIINIASIDGQVGFQKLVAQCASKAGLIGFTKALAKELWNRPITVNAVCPAEVDKDVAYADTPDRVPAPQKALPRDVAEAVRYLASAAAVRVNGTCIDVHGVGFLAS